MTAAGSADLFPGPWQPQVVLMAALEVGLIDALLAEPKSPAEVARGLGLDERATTRVIAVLSDAGYLEQQEGGVVVPSKLRDFLDPADPAYVGARLAHLHNPLARWLELPTVLRSGAPPRLGHTAESQRAFVGAMRSGARGRAELLAKRLAELFPATRAVLDVGGGPVTQALAFRKLGWRVTVLDLPEVIKLTADALRREGIAVIAGDAIRGIPTAGFDLVFCGNLFHALSAADCEAVVDNAAAALRRSGAFAIYDFLRGGGLQSSLFAVNMLVATSAGDVYGEEEYRRWCEAADLTDFTVHVLAGQPQRLLTAVKDVR